MTRGGAILPPTLTTGAGGGGSAVGRPPTTPPTTPPGTPPSTPPITPPSAPEIEALLGSYLARDLDRRHERLRLLDDLRSDLDDPRGRRGWRRGGGGGAISSGRTKKALSASGFGSVSEESRGTSTTPTRSTRCRHRDTASVAPVRPACAAGSISIWLGEMTLGSRGVRRGATASTGASTVAVAWLMAFLPRGDTTRAVPAPELHKALCLRGTERDAVSASSRNCATASDSTRDLLASEPRAPQSGAAQAGTGSSAARAPATSGR